MTRAQGETKPAESNRAQVMQAAGLVGAAILASRLLGLVRDAVTKYYLGLGLEATAYDAASRFPEAIFLVIAGGAIGSAFIPTFAAYFARDDEPGAWRLFSVVINLVTLTVILIAGITAVFAPQFITVFLPKLIAEDPRLLPLTVKLMRVMLLSTVIFGASGVIMGALNARQHFLLPALAPIVYNLGIILGILVWPPAIPGEPQSKVMGLAVGTVIGALGHLTVQLPGLRRKQARYSPVLTLRDPGVRQVLRLMAPRILGLSFSQINSFVTLYLSGFMTLESLPALTSALRIMIMPQGILGQAMGIAAFPTLATLAAQSALDEMRHILATALRLIVFLGLPASVLLITLREPIIVILLQRGAFGPADTQLVAWALLFYAAGLVALTSLEVIARAFYALNDTLTPVLAGGVQVLGMALLSLWLSQEIFPIFGWLPLGGLALGFSLSNFLEVGLLLGLLRRKMGGINGWILLDGLWRMSIASLLMAGVTWITLAGLETAAVWWQALLGAAAGGMVYMLACLGLSVEEAQHFFRFSRRFLK